MSKDAGSATDPSTESSKCFMSRANSLSSYGD